MLLPAVAVLAVYGWLIAGKKRDELTRAEKALEDARAKAPNQATVYGADARLLTVNREIALLGRQEAELKKQWQALTACCTKPGSRPERAEKLTTLFGRHALTLIDSGPAEEKEARLSPALAKLAEDVGERAAGQKPQLWRFHMRGKYADVLQALESLSSGETLALPVIVTMKEADARSALHEWTLVVWI